jgi:predicted N-acetyltransferase YhbS
MFVLELQQSEDVPEIEFLLDLVFGPDRRNKSSYRFRHGVAPIDELSFVAHSQGKLVGTIRYWPIAVGAIRMPALLLGPLGVHPEFEGLGIGAKLMTHSLRQAKSLGHDLVCLVGDPPYYERFGFKAGENFGLVMNGENARFQALRLTPNMPQAASGQIYPLSAVELDQRDCLRRYLINVRALSVESDRYIHASCHDR